LDVVVVGWGLLNEVSQPAWMLTSSFFKPVLFPRLFPRFGLDTPRTSPQNYRWNFGLPCPDLRAPHQAGTNLSSNPHTTEAKPALNRAQNFFIFASRFAPALLKNELQRTQKFRVEPCGVTGHLNQRLMLKPTASFRQKSRAALSFVHRCRCFLAGPAGPDP